MSLEMRAFEPAIFRDGHNKMLALDGLSTVQSISDGYPCRVHVDVQGEWEPWSRNAATDNLLQLWQETAVSLGMSVGSEERGGLSDGNQTWRFVPTIDGLGPEGDNAHCSQRSEDGSKDQEYALQSSFVPKAVLNTAAIIQLITSRQQKQQPLGQNNEILIPSS
jgi:glutamate carboxypeptidase